MHKTIIMALAVMLAMTQQGWSAEIFKTGPVFTEFGRHADVAHINTLSANTQLKVAFDVSESASEQQRNRRFDSLARFINMHVANGVPRDNIAVALVVHGKAGQDLLKNTAYQQRNQTNNASADLVNALLDNNVAIFLCGQSAAYHKLDSKDLIDGVQVALSAMTAHALLNQQGYSLNPF